MSEKYDADYFINGRKTGKSLYDNYRWLPDLTIPMVCTMISRLGIKSDDTILDFGCARGYTVRAMREMGYDAFGYDVSQWAIDNCDPWVKRWVFCRESLYPSAGYDWIIAKDVLEHVPNVKEVINGIMDAASVGVFVVVPLSNTDGGEYVVKCYEKDETHIHRWTLATWLELFLRPGWVVEATYRAKGIKDNYAKYENGNGFITCRREI